MSSCRNANSGTARAGALALALLSGACSSEGGGEWRGLFTIARDSWERRDGFARLDEAAMIPYATLGVRVGDESERIIILATDANGVRLWTSAARIAITTRGGRIVSTAGLAYNLSGYNSEAAFATPVATARKFTWLADYADMGLYSVNIDCTDTVAGIEAITILGKEFSTQRVDETCRSEMLDWTFANTYWVSQSSNRVWRSIQHVHPKLVPLEIELLRPPQSPD